MQIMTETTILLFLPIFFSSRFTLLFILHIGKKTVGDFPCHNWFIIYGLFLGLAYTSFIMFTPSIYQFVTASKNSSEESEVLSGRN